MERPISGKESSGEKELRRIHRREQLSALLLGIQLSQRLEKSVIDVNLRRQKAQRIVESMFLRLPDFVSSVKIGDDVVRRSQPTEGRKEYEWTLEDIDRYAALRARSAGLHWKRNFPKKDTS